MLTKILPPIIYIRFERFAAQILQYKAILIQNLLFKYPVSLFKNYPGFLYPKELFIFLTTRCNIRCFICRRENHVAEDLVFADIYRLEHAIKNASIIDLTGWGEPLIYPKFKEVLHYIYSINAKPNLIRITTNGTLLSGEIAQLLTGHLNKVTISLNAATKETYNRDMKHADFHRTTDNIRSFVMAVSSRDISSLWLHFVAHTENYKEIPEFVRLASSLHIKNVTIGNYLVGRADHARYSLMLVKDDYNRVVSQAWDLSLKLGINLFARKFHVEKAIPPQLCTDPYIQCFVLPNGDVGPCCYAGNSVMGNVFKTSFEDVWFGEAYRALRRSRHLPACKHCTPYVVLDDPNAHFVESLKQSDEIRAILRSLSPADRSK